MKCLWNTTKLSRSFFFFYILDFYRCLCKQLAQKLISMLGFRCFVFWVFDALKFNNYFVLSWKILLFCVMSYFNLLNMPEINHEKIQPLNSFFRLQLYYSSKIISRVGNRPGRPTGAYDLACFGLAWPV